MILRGLKHDPSSTIKLILMAPAGLRDGFFIHNYMKSSIIHLLYCDQLMAICDASFISISFGAFLFKSFDKLDKFSESIKL